MSEPKSIAEEIREGLRNLERGLALVAEKLDGLAKKIEQDKRAPEA